LQELRRTQREVIQGEMDAEKAKHELIEPQYSQSTRPATAHNALRFPGVAGTRSTRQPPPRGFHRQEVW
jgi:hypothetical protein